MNQTSFFAVLTLPLLAACAGAAPPSHPPSAAMPEPKVADAPEVVPEVSQQETLVLSDAACEDDTLCALAGLCSADGPECVAGDDAECRRSQQCLTDGACSARDGECVAVSDDECADSEACIREGRCTARDGYCAT